MLYVRNLDKTLVDLIHSDNEMCVYVKAGGDAKRGSDGSIGTGVIFKGSKKEFKTLFKKAPKKVREHTQILSQDAIEQVLESTLTDRYGLLHHTSDYLKHQEELYEKEVKEMHSLQSEEEYRAMLDSLKD